MFYEDGERPQGFRVTAVQGNELVSIFENVATTRDALNGAEVAQINSSLSRSDSSAFTYLASRAPVVAIVAAHLAEQASDGTESMTTIHPGGTSGAGGSGDASSSSGGACSGGAAGSGNAGGAS